MEGRVPAFVTKIICNGENLHYEKLEGLVEGLTDILTDVSIHTTLV